jgi:hypothetical protein
MEASEGMLQLKSKDSGRLPVAPCLASVTQSAPLFFGAQRVFRFFVVASRGSKTWG